MEERIKQITETLKARASALGVDITQPIFTLTIGDAIERIAERIEEDECRIRCEKSYTPTVEENISDDELLTLLGKAPDLVDYINDIDEAVDGADTLFSDALSHAMFPEDWEDPEDEESEDEDYEEDDDED